MDFSKTFSDSAGRTWTVEITVGTLPRLKSVAGITLDDIIPKKVTRESMGLSTLADFLSDPVAILQAVYAICKPQIDKAGLTFDNFAEGFEGENAVACCEAMAQALLQAIHDFFLYGTPISQPMRAAMLKRALSIGKKLATAEAEKSAVALDRIEAKVMAEMTKPIPEIKLMEMDREVDAALKKFAGNTPEVSGSTLAS